MENKTGKTLLDEFSTPSYDEWLQLVEAQLKGAPFEKKLVTKTAEGIAIQPFYRREDNRSFATSTPGSYPFVRHSRARGNLEEGWQVSQQFVYADPEEFNRAATYDLSRGLTSVAFSLDLASGRGIDPGQDGAADTGKSGLSLVSHQDLAKAFQSFDFDTVSLQINPRVSFLPFLGLLIDYLDRKKIDRQALKGNMMADPLSELAINGGLSVSLEKIYLEMAACVAWAARHTPQFKTLGINLCPYADAGASATQELSVALATGVEYLRQLQNKGVDFDVAAGNMVFYLSMGSDFFLNIAKIRAARRLWARVIELCDGAIPSQKMTLYACTSRYNKTQYDPHVNLLRATTEAYAAVLAGCDSVNVAPFDDVFGQPDEMSRRISRNIQIVLKEECHGHKIIDPGGGAWFLEELTDQLAHNSWQEFQDMEKSGGITESLLKGELQRQISDVAKNRKDDVANRKRVIVGTNMYSKQDENLPQTRLIDYAAFSERRAQEISRYKSARNLDKQLSAADRKREPDPETLVETVLNLAKKEATLGQLSQALAHGTKNCLTADSLPDERLASDYEALRQKAAAYKEEHGDWPEIYLIKMGPLKQHKARADFVTGFLEPGGFKVISDNGFETVKEAVAATLTVKTGIAVICSTDDTYPELVPDMAGQIKAARPNMILALAGYPKDQIDSFKKSGIDEFIHVKANNLSILKMFHQNTEVSS